MDSMLFDFGESSPDWPSDEEDEDDEANYDALNDETFGDVSLADGDDWEEEHEKLARITESSRVWNANSQNEETNELSKQIASSVLIEDVPTSILDMPNVPFAKKRFLNLSSHFFDQVKLNDSPVSNLPLNISYVGDIERNLRENLSKPNVINHGVDVPNLRQVDEVEKELTLSVPPNQGTIGQSVISLLPSATVQPSTGPLQIPSINHLSLVGIRPPHGPMNFVNSGHPNQSLGQPIRIINPPFGPLIPPNQTMVHPSLNRNGLPPVPMPPGPHLMAPPHLNQQAFNFHHSPHQQSRVFYSSNNRQLRHHIHPPQLPNQNYGAHPYINLRRNNLDFSNSDDYSGLMTDQEKNWLAQIQLLQLNNLHPYQDDFYFTMNQCKKPGGHNNSIWNCNSPPLHNHNKANGREGGPSSKNAYSPQQFENSLGKLQVGSVTAPRKIIDMDVVDCTDSDCASSPNLSTNSVNFRSTSSRTKQILLDIEMMFVKLLTAEDYLNPNSGIEPANGEDPHDLINSIGLKLMKDLSYMSSLKGKKLLLRVLPYLKAEIVSDIIKNILTHLTSVCRKDGDQTLLQLLPFVRKWILAADLADLNDIIYTNLATISAIFGNTFAISVLANLFERGEAVIDSSEDTEINRWVVFVSTFVMAVPSHSFIGRPVVGLDPAILERHFDFCTVALKANDCNVTDLFKKKLSELIKALSNTTGSSKSD